MESIDKKCKKCGSQDLFRDKRKDQNEDTRCLLCGLTGSHEEVVIAENKANQQENKKAK